ncbi:hypothetical protein LSCM1_00354 [Leishmania martiniquensis]|uniref:Uncharacterized protein n=1 Tax=Leishmania martiniquensis TaxID=1580590 RepID=A0A836G108_9TRYP|nr:hypothetical protein LSCM1_00354 [Leishmania martiniquensis]
MSCVKEPLHRLAFGSITLPNIPRIAADEKSRQKYLSEYEKYEPELRRHHLGAAETTNTIGLKDVPAEFDRTVPSLLGPTEAEQEYERTRESRKAPPLRKGYRGASARTSHVAVTDTLTPAARKSISLPLSQVPQSDEGPPQVVTPTNSRPSSAVSTPATASAAPEAGEEAVGLDPVKADGTRESAAAVVEAAPARIPRPPSALPKRKPPTVATPGSQPRARTAPSLKPPLATGRLGQRDGASSAAYARVAKPKLPQPDRPLRAASPTTAHGAESTARLLRVLLNPPPQYTASLRLDLSFFDLGWLQSGQAAPHRLTTLESRFSNKEVSPRFRINSPRSVITLLEKGASPEDWDPPSGVFSSAAISSPTCVTQDIAAVQTEVCAHRRAYVQAQRDALCRSLQDSYSALCARAPLDEVIRLYRRLSEADTLTFTMREEELLPLATVVQQRQERQRRMFESSKNRMMREVQRAKELQEQEDAAVQRKLQAEAEAEEERRRKALEEQEARRLVQARLEAHHAERQRREEVYRQHLQARLERAEARKAERMAARERQLQAIQEQREAREAERARRLERKTALLEEQAVAQEQKRREKEATCEQLRAMREARIAEEHRALVEKQQRAACLREEARQRAAEAEEAMRQAALQRQLDAEERLRELQARRKEEAVERAAATAAHHERLNEIRSQAVAKEELLKATHLERYRQEEERHRNARSRQLADIMWRREAEWEQDETKAYLMLQLQRIAEFKKLHTVASLLEKHKAACTVVRQRELICEEAMRAREKLRAERDALKHLISSLPQ